MIKKRILLAASAALLLLSCATNAHKAASDEEDSVSKIEDPAKLSEDIPFIENLNQKKEVEEEEIYQGPKDFNYCKEMHCSQKIYRLQQIYL